MRFPNSKNILTLLTNTRFSSTPLRSTLLMSTPWMLTPLTSTSFTSTPLRSKPPTSTPSTSTLVSTPLMSHHWRQHQTVFNFHPLFCLKMPFWNLKMFTLLDLLLHPLALASRQLTFLTFWLWDASLDQSSPHPWNAMIIFINTIWLFNTHPQWYDFDNYFHLVLHWFRLSLAMASFGSASLSSGKFCARSALSTLEYVNVDVSIESA